MNAEGLEKETRTIPKNTVDGIYIKRFDDKIMNISEGLTSTGRYEKDGNSWIDNRLEGRGRLKNINATVNQTLTTKIVTCLKVGLDSLGVTCSPRDPRFAGSNPTEVIRERL